MVVNGKGDSGALAVGLRHETTGVGLRALAAKALHVAVCAPARLIDVYDGAAHGWLSSHAFPPSTRNQKLNPPPAKFWQAFWQILEEAVATRRRAPFTLAVMRLAGLLDPGLNDRVAAAALQHPGVRDATTAGLLERIRIRELSGFPPTSLGGAAHREAMVRGQVDQFLDLDTLSRADLPPPLDYLNARLLESHPVWAALAGYGEGELDEIALAAFRMGQFGHHHSSLLVGLTMATVAFDRPPGLETVLDSIFRGWMHGRETPPLLDIAWSDLWHLPIDAVRQQLGVTLFPSPLTAAISQGVAAPGAN